MKRFHTSKICLLVVMGACVVSGCATTGQNSASALPASPVEGMNGIEQKQPSPTADMDWFQATAYYFGKFSLTALYAFASTNPSFSP